MHIIKGQKGPVQILSADGQVTIVPDNEDRFIMTAQSAVQACQSQEKLKRAVQAFKTEFIAPLFEWVENNKAAVSKIFIPVPSQCIEVYVIGASPSYDFELGKQLSRLEMKLHEEGWNVSVLQIPQADLEELSTYFDPDSSLEIHA